jgi:hypothetical protein
MLSCAAAPLVSKADEALTYLWIWKHQRPLWSAQPVVLPPHGRPPVDAPARRAAQPARTTGLRCAAAVACGLWPVCVRVCVWACRKFKKVRQVYLLKHKFDPERLPKKNFKEFLESGRLTTRARLWARAVR